MEWILSGGIASALVLLYFVSKRNGKLEAKLEAKELQIKAQADDMEFILKDIEIMQRQIFQWNEFREEVYSKIKGIDIALVNDGELQSMYKDPVQVEVTDPYTTKLDQGKPSK